MTYLPKTSGSEEDNTEQAEELEVRFYKYLVKLKSKFLILLYSEEEIIIPVKLMCSIKITYLDICLFYSSIL